MAVNYIFYWRIFLWKHVLSLLVNNSWYMKIYKYSQCEGGGAQLLNPLQRTLLTTGKKSVHISGLSSDNVLW